MKSKNIKFEYRYRDAANYKQYGGIVFCNPEKLSLANIEFFSDAATEFKMQSWNLNGLPDYKPGRRSAVPICISLSELMKAKVL